METESEVWKYIPDYEGYYEISNFGNLRSCDRQLKDRFLKSQPIKFSIRNGYYRATIYKNRKISTKSINVLVATIFIQNPSNKPCVNHKDGIKTNNFYKNLEWVTYSENNKHSYDKLDRKGAWKGKSGNLHPRYKNKDL